MPPDAPRTHRVRARYCFAPLLFLSACNPACIRSSVELSEPTVPALGLDVELVFSGCQEIAVGPICWRSDLEEPLVIWVAAPADELRVRGGSVTTTIAVAGGTRLIVQAGRGAPAIVIARGSAESRIALRPAPPSDVLRQAEILRASDPERAITLAASVASADEPLLRVRAAGILGRIAASRRHRAEMSRHLDAASDIAQQHGLVSMRYRDLALSIFYNLYMERDLATASAHAARAQGLPRDDAAARMRLRYYEGMLALQTFEIARALDLFHDALLGAHRIGDLAGEVEARLGLVEAYSVLGRSYDAGKHLAALSALPLRDLPSCVEAAARSNLGWFLFSSGTPDQRPAAREQLQAALQLYAEACKNPQNEGSALASLASLDLEEGDSSGAAALLVRAASIAPDIGSGARVGRLELKARIEAATGQPRDAERLYAELEALGISASLPQVTWRAALGRAGIQVSRGRIREAERLYEDADKRLDALHARIPLGEGRDSFSQAQERIIREHVGLLIEARRPELALALARRNLSRPYRTLNVAGRIARMSPLERDLWRVELGRFLDSRDALEAALAEQRSVQRLARVAPADELPELERSFTRTATVAAAARRAVQRALNGLRRSLPGGDATDRGLSPAEAGTVLLVLHPIPTGWVTFVVRSEGPVRFQTTTATGTPEVQAVLRGVGAALEDVSKVVVIAHASLESLDLADAIEGGAPRFSGRTVYGVELGRTLRPPAAGRAVVVSANATGDLPWVDRETKELARLMGEHRIDVELLSGAAVTRDGLEAALARRSTELLHFAGHGTTAGRDGWEHSLQLAGDTLTSADILALSNVPRQVVLSACRAGATSTSEAAAGLGVAHSFILAGADRVIASAVVVEDRRAFEIMRTLYLGLVASSTVAGLIGLDENTLRGTSFRVLEVR